MEIDKISFENMRILGVSASFEELDVNGDGKISKDDISLTTDKKISSQIMQVLSFEDEDSELITDELPMLKSGASNTENVQLAQTTTDSFENDVTNSKGTTYVILRTNACSNCKKLANELSDRSSEFSGKANIYELNIKDEKLFWSLVNKSGQMLSRKDGTNYTNVPIVLKYVDGEYKEVVKGSSAENIVNSMLNKAEGATSTTPSTLNDDCSDGSCSAESPVSAETQQSSTNAALQAQLTRYKSLNALLDAQLKIEENKLEDIKKEQNEKQEEIDKLQKELEEKQAEYESLIKEINSASEEDGISALQEKAEDLKSEISSISDSISRLNDDMKLLTEKYEVQLLMYDTQKKSIEVNQQKIDELSKNISASNKVATNLTSNSTNATNTGSTDNIDWTALSVEGKGVNLYNLFNLLDKSTGTETNDYDGAIVSAEVEKLYQNGTDEQKAILEKMFKFTEKGTLSSEEKNKVKILFTTMGEVGSVGLASLAYYDADHDGFLSDDEIKEMKNKVNTEYDKINRQNQINGGRTYKDILGNKRSTTKEMLGTGIPTAKQELYGSYTFAQTVVNGKTVYFGQTKARSQILTVTEDEISILDEYLKDESVYKGKPVGTGKYVGYGVKDLSDIWNALGATEIKSDKTQSVDGQNYRLTYKYGYANSKSKSAHVFVNSAGVICSYLQYEGCAMCDESFYFLYKGIKEMIAQNKEN